MSGKTSTSIVVAAVVTGKHCWPEAPDHRDYLRTLHRHDFRFVAHVVVRHDDRDIEFHDLRDRILLEVERLGEPYEGNRPTAWKPDIWTDFGRRSCEELGRLLLHALGKGMPCWKVEVWEDSDNGAIYEEPWRRENMYLTDVRPLG